MNDKKPIFVILTPGFPKDENDSTCLPAQQLFVRKLKENFSSLEIVVVTFQYPLHKSAYQWNGINVISLGGQNRRKFARLMTWFQAAKTLGKIQRSKKISGILSFWCTETALVGKWFGKLHTIQQRTWILGQDARKGNGFIKWIRPSSDELIAMSDFLAEEFFKNYGIKPACVIPNGVDIKLFDRKAAERPIDVLGVGSLIPLKQYDVFLRITHELKKHYPAIRTIICGKGKEENRLTSLIDKLELNENVYLAGEKEHPDVIRLMQQTKVFLHPSSYEGFSGACLEALYAGADVVSFCKPMKEEIPNWHVVTNEDKMLRKVLTALQEGNSSHTQPATFSMEVSAKKIMALYGHKA
jgi:glycosyltransferase involved in cell wall biosynthesis